MLKTRSIEQESKTDCESGKMERYAVAEQASREFVMKQRISEKRLTASESMIIIMTNVTNKGS